MGTYSPIYKSTYDLLRGLRGLRGLISLSGVISTLNLQVWGVSEIRGTFLVSPLKGNPTVWGSIYGLPFLSSAPHIIIRAPVFGLVTL